MRKPIIWDSEKVRDKAACTVTEEGYKIEISDLRRRGIVLSVSHKQMRLSAVQKLHNRYTSLLSSMHFVVIRIQRLT